MIIYHMAIQGAGTQFTTLWANARSVIGVCFLQTVAARPAEALHN